jgi:putative sugar O-methyltransferase
VADPLSPFTTVDSRRSALERPSRFWQQLGAQHTGDLKSFGLETFKRHQALRYFNWRWRIGAAPASAQLRFLLTHTSPATWLRAANTRMDLSEAAWAECRWPRRDRAFYTFAVRLLWSYAESDDLCEVLELPEPTLGAPYPVHWRNRLISQDLANSALEVSGIHRSRGGRPPQSILEVGAGYGRTAYALLGAYPEARYTIVDIDPALTISRWYLTQLFSPERLRFVRPSEAESLPTGSFDLALSISSLAEMRPAQVEGYLAIVDRVASGGTVFLKQWAEWRNPADQVTMRFTEYPIPTRWQPNLHERSAVQTGFLQAGWDLPPLGPRPNGLDVGVTP